MVDGRAYIVRPRKTEKTVHGLRAGPAKVRLYALSDSGFSKAAVIKIHVKKSVAQAPKVTLKLGMHGPDVRHLQKALFMRHPSGTFGKGTRAAVIEWQGFYGMKRTGEVNDRMRYLLNV
jgi:peptidoglycan hydrolase-like protein with peptidoglycan-binding domain